MGLNQSKEKMKRKNETEEGNPNVLCKRIKLSNPDTVREPIKRSTEQDEIVDIREKLSTANRYIAGLTEILSSSLRCVECGDYPRGRPVYSCPGHHLTCAECPQDQQSPPHCKTCSRQTSELSLTPLQRKLLQFVDRNCCWQSEGCSQQGNLNSILQHEAACSHQLVSCWACGDTAALRNFHHHSQDLTCFHKQKMFESPVMVKMSVKVTRAVALTCGGDIFYLRVLHLKSQSVWVVYLAAQLCQEDCQTYKARLEVSSSSPHSGGISRLPGRPSSLVHSLEEVMKSGNYILISQPDMNNIASHNGVFNLSCEIIRNPSN